jgi:hypothetical protein
LDAGAPCSFADATGGAPKVMDEIGLIDVVEPVVWEDFAGDSRRQHCRSGWR